MAAPTLAPQGQLALDLDPQGQLSRELEVQGHTNVFGWIGPVGSAGHE